MYKNIGKKIKRLAKTIFIIEAVIIGILVMTGAIAAFSSILVGTMALFELYDLSDIVWAEIFSIILAVLFILVCAAIVFAIGAFFAYMSTWMLYAFGELVDKTCDIEENTRKAKELALPYERLVQLEESYQNGTITKEEYDTMRENIINP